jgi:glycerol-3-phosphate dehydrogenase (NAD(P)+)
MESKKEAVDQQINRLLLKQNGINLQVIKKNLYFCIKHREMKICIIGAGALGTALGNVIAAKNDNDVTLWSIEEDVVRDISGMHHNHKYFPGVLLNKNLKATGDVRVMTGVDVLFLAVPSSVIPGFIQKNKKLISRETLVVNLAKGFGPNKETLVETLEEILPDNPIGTLKGPSFARDIINNVPTAFTYGVKDKQYRKIIKELFKKTTIYLDFTKEVVSVELVSILKNIYAVSMGIADAHFDSPNLRFLFLTKAFREMRSILKELGGDEEVLFKYCGFGDFALTALNDLSRNRTLGLLIGKGFFTKDNVNNVVLEGRLATEVFYNKMCDIEGENSKYPIVKELYYVFDGKNDISKFVHRIIR